MIREEEGERRQSILDKLKAALREAYGFHAQQVERIAYGLWEESFSVWTREKRYYVKRFYAKWRLQTRYPDMLKGLALSQELRQKGFPAPALILTIDNDWLANVDGETYQVNEWVDGCCYHPGELQEDEARAMGGLLARFHCQFERAEPSAKMLPYVTPAVAIHTCEELRLRYESAKGAFPSYVRSLLAQQILLLKSLPSNFTENLPTATLSGPCFHSFWVEQVIFQPNGQIAALVDWTDGAGKPGLWAQDIVTGIHLSALNETAIIAFCSGYQNANRLPKNEWKAVFTMLCYGHVASTNFLDSWLVKHNRRMEHWEKIAKEWTCIVPQRFIRWRELEEKVLDALFVQVDDQAANVQYTSK